MDIETVKQLQSSGVGITLMLKEVDSRALGKEWHLVAMCEFLDILGKKPVPASFVIQTSRARHTLVTQCEVAGVSFADVPLLAGTARTRAKASGPARGQCQRSCNLCSKADFDSASGCHNPSVFSFGVGDWVCNLTAPFQGRQ